MGHWTEIEPEILRSAEGRLEDLGTLSLEELRVGWGLDAGQAERVLQVLSRRRDVRRRKGLGRQRIELSRRRGWPERGGPEREGSEGEGPTGEEAEGLEIELPSEWQRRSVDRLLEILKYRELEDLLAGLLFTLRSARRAETGEDRRGTKRELATALVLRHGVDLLASPGVRRAVGRATGFEPPGRWHPAKAGAIGFARDTGFPPELAGRPLPASPPSLEFLESHPELKPLQDFQQEIQRKLLMALYVPDGRAMVSLPTGAGKTRVAVESLATWLLDRWDHELEQSERGVAVWLAHTEELCEQAIACFQDVWRSSKQVPPTTLARLWGAYTKKDEEAEELQNALLGSAVLVSTPNRLMTLIDDGAAIAGLIRCNAGLVVIDEAHRAAAPTYRKLLEFFRDGDQPVSVVGLTATPFRMEYDEENPTAGTEELREIFGRLLEPRQSLGPYARKRLQERGILATPTVETLHTTTAIRLDEDADTPLFQDDIERIDQLLAIRTDRTPRRLEILQEILPLAQEPDHQILYFGPSVQDAECMAFLLQRRSVPAAVVSGASRRSARRQAIEQFKEGAIRVLCNCEVLTTGFDAPRVTHVVMGRPTVSQVLYEQMVGRGLRGEAFGGTRTCTILDCVDDYRGTRPELGYEAFRSVWYPEEMQDR